MHGHPVVNGAWVGWYQQGGERFPQRQELVFADGIVRGTGTDTLGPFRVEGEYRTTGARSARVGWIKTYDGSHDVLYLGEWDGHGITGLWEIYGSGDAFGFEPAEGR